MHASAAACISWRLFPILSFAQIWKNGTCLCIEDVLKSFSLLYLLSVPNNIRSDPIMMWHSWPLWAIKVEMQSLSSHKHGLYNQTCGCTFHTMVSVHPCTLYLHDYESTKLATAFDGTRMIRGPWSWSRIQRSFGKHRIFHWEVMIPKDQILWHQRLHQYQIKIIS